MENCYFLFLNLKKNIRNNLQILKFNQKFTSKQKVNHCQHIIFLF
jgi:hypothetical protein